MENLLDPVLKLIGLFRSDIGKPRLVMGERIGSGSRVENRVLDPVELKLEKQQVGCQNRRAVLHITIEFRPFRVTGVARVNEAGIGNDPTEHVIKRLIGADGLS